MGQPNSQPETFADVQPIQQETFSNVTPLVNSPAQPSVWQVLTQPTEKTDQEYTNYRGPAGVVGATAKGLNDVARGTRGALAGAWQAIPEAWKVATHPLETTREAQRTANDQAAQVPSAVRDINASPDPVGSYANAAQDTASQGAGQALTALAGSAVPDLPVGRLARVAGKVAKGTIEDIPGVRQVGRLSKYWKETAPKAGTPSNVDEFLSQGASKNEAALKGYQAKRGQVAEQMHGPPTPTPELVQSQPLASVKTPASQPASQTGEALGTIPQRGQIAKAAQSQPVSADAAKQFARKSLQKMLGDQLEEGLGAEKLDPQAPIATRPDALPEGHTPVQSSALRSYKYDPGAREFHARATSGDTTYIYGDVAPEDAQAFEQAESKGKAWQQIRQNPLVAKVVNGKRVAVKPSATAGKSASD